MNNPLQVLGFIAIVGVAVYFVATGVVDLFPEEGLDLLRLLRGAAPALQDRVEEVIPPSGSIGSPLVLSAPPSSSPPPPAPAPSDIPPGFAKEQISPSWRKVRITSASPASSPGSYSQISLSASLNQGEKISLNGWRIRTKKDLVTIPGAVAVYIPSGTGPVESIVLENGDYAYLYSSRSNVGVSFRLNKCMGYFETVYDFKPTLPSSCPRVYDSRSDIVNFTSRCQDYITSLGTCAIPDLNRAPVDDSACHDFLSGINYGSCFVKHRGDPDFLSREWRVFLGDPSRERDVLDGAHDRVELYDRDGKLVDQYVY